MVTQSIYSFLRSTCEEISSYILAIWFGVCFFFSQPWSLRQLLWALHNTIHAHQNRFIIWFIQQVVPTDNFTVPPTHHMVHSMATLASSSHSSSPVAWTPSSSYTTGLALYHTAFSDAAEISLSQTVPPPKLKRDSCQLHLVILAVQKIQRRRSV